MHSRVSALRHARLPQAQAGRTENMTGCCAYGCSNRSEQGFRMYRFPTNTQRRKIWENKVKRKNWKPTNSSLLCHAHFTENQFENGRGDGKKKLKASAIPTIFVHRRVIHPRRSPKRRCSPAGSSILQKAPLSSLSDHTYCQTVDPSSETKTSSTSEASATEEEMTPAASDAEHRCTMTEKLRANLRKTKRKCRAILKAKERQQKRISRIFSKDQLEALSRNGTQGMQWTAKTVKKALCLRFACGSSGYRCLIGQQYPLPSERTLQRRLQMVNFQPGVLRQVFEFLKLKVEAMQEEERLCSLTLDEMSLTSKVEFDAGSESLTGYVTLPKHSGAADHALVFMLGGITTRWKQTVAYHFTSNSTDGTVFKEIILDIIHCAADIGLHVISVTSDMGSSNQAMWKSFGVVCGKQCRTENRIPHPQDPPGKWLYFLADVPHLFKNVKAALVNGQNFSFPQSIVDQYHLKSSVVNVKPLHDLADFQAGLDLKIAPKLTKVALTPSHFEKMKVSNATRVLSHDVSSALRYLVQREERSEDYLTTAWFIELVNHWFELMTSRHPILALSKLNSEKYKETVTFLKNVITVFKSLSVGNGSWKPIQTGVVLSTTSVLQLADQLLNAGNKFVLTARLTQDCLENLFSVVRLRKPVPSPLEFKYALKLISSAQFLTLKQEGSYDQDEGEFLAPFLTQNLQVSLEPGIPDPCLSDEELLTELPQVELDSLYNLAGYCINSIKKNEKTCDGCLSEVTGGPQDGPHHAAALTLLKEYRPGCLQQVSEKAFNMLVKVETLFRGKENNLMKESNIKDVLVTKAEQVTKDTQISSCHNLKHKLINKFINVRLHFFCRKRNQELLNEAERRKKRDELGSKSMTMRTLAKKVK